MPRNAVQPKHFSSWVDWAKEKNHGLDFNADCFSHPLAEDGFTLSHQDEAVREFWIEHCIASREVGAYFGSELGSPAVTNFWIPDGYKDTPVDRTAPRVRLLESLDRVFEKEIDPTCNLDAVESKLFGLGSESYVVGSHEFYLGYAVTRGKLLCLDAGHFHPTETISDKISAVMPYVPGLLLHVSRGVRWDSDHVVSLNDELQAIMQELVRGEHLDRTHIGLDFFDASINRVAAWVIGARSTLKALLMALLEPVDRLRQLELDGDYTSASRPVRRAEKACPSARCGIITASSSMYRLGSTSCLRSKHTRKTSYQSGRYYLDWQICEFTTNPCGASPQKGYRHYEY